MATFKKKDLNELVGGDVFAGGNDRNVTNNSEIDTGPVQKPYNDDSDYEKGTSTTTDRVVGRYRQDIPWFAVYSYSGTRSGTGINEKEEKSVVIKKKNVEEKIEDLVKKSKDSDVTEKGYNPKVSKLIDSIKDCELSDKQLKDLENAILDKKNKENNQKNL
jgi:predicted DNA binding protein